MQVNDKRQVKAYKAAIARLCVVYYHLAIRQRKWAEENIADPSERLSTLGNMAYESLYHMYEHNSKSLEPYHDCFN